MYSCVLWTLLLTLPLLIKGDQVKRTDVCENSGKFLKCDSKSVLKIKDVVCMPNNYTCPEKDRIVSICEGQSSCESFGLRQQLWTYCQDQPRRTVVVDFSCESVENTPQCRTNLCIEEARDLLCPVGSTIHVTRMKCGPDDDQRCPWNLNYIIYPTCEGKQQCGASGLRILGLDNVCRNRSFVLVDYICVQNSEVHGTCTGITQKLPARFGVIKSPGFPQNPDGNPDGCVWTIALGLGKRIDVTVHMSYSREETDGNDCSAKFLHVHYKDCRTMTDVAEYFCQTHNVNIARQSCGDVRVQSYSYYKGEDRGNRFLVSYEVIGYDVKGPSFAPYILPCGSTGSGLIASSKEIKDGGYLTSDDGKSGNGTVMEYPLNPRKFSFILKIVMINFLLFVLAFILVISICLVCYKTRQIDRKGNYQISKETKDNEKVGSSKQREVNDDTRILLGDNHENTHSNKANNHYSAVHNKSSYDGIYNEIRPDVNAGGTTLTEVVPRKKKDPYASYDSLDFDDGVGADMVGGKRYSARCSAEIAVSSILPPGWSDLSTELEKTLPNGHQDNEVFVDADGGVPHVQINNDYYAIVQKSKTLPNGKNSPVTKNSFEMVTHTNCSNGVTGGPFSSSGALPQHDCMLHNGEQCSKVPPFPNPETYDNLNDTTVSSSSA